MRVGPVQLLVIVVFVCSGFGCSKQKERGMDRCTLDASIQTYHRKVVRVTAFIGSGPEQEALYDPTCRDGRPLVSITLKSDVMGAVDELRSIVDRKRYAYVTVEGTVYGPEPVEVDPKLPDWVKDRLKGSTKRYGH